MNKDNTANSFDVDVKINYKITLDNKVKGVNPNIIKAARQGIFDADIYHARIFHYNRSTSNDIYIFEVNDKGNNTWEILFREKKQTDASYDTNGYSLVTVEKQKSGSFRGYIIGSSPDIRDDETF
ncbi:MAG: hypothetical protein Q8936_10790 [Bacillota bacterium]|nr:hypothetical protein [Bacillota bacterium]